MIRAYLFPETEESVNKKMSEAALPEGLRWEQRAGEYGIVLTADGEDDDALKARLKKIFGFKLYSFEKEIPVEALVQRLSEKKRRIAAAESCTGGLLAKKITDVSGASAVFGLGLTVYSDEAKESLLNVSKKILDEHTAVSREVAKELCENIRKKAGSTIGVGITGYAGPDGGKDGTPVGTVYIGVSSKNECIVEKLQFGDKLSRDQIREESVKFAIAMVNKVLDDLDNGVAVPKKKSIFDKVNGFFVSAYRYLFPQKGDILKEKIRKIAFLVAVAVFIGSISYIGNYYLGRLRNDLEIDKLQEEYSRAPTQEELDNLPEGYLKKFARLYSINSDVVGWLKAGKTIDFPVVQTKDNDFYLKRDFYKNDNFHGVPYMDYRCNPKLITTNTVIYGHNVKPDRMFAELTNYKKLAYYKQYPTFTYDTVYEEHTFKILYVMVLDSDSSRGDYFGYQNFISATGDNDFYKFINNCKKRTLIDTTVDVNPTDTLLTLSTCGFDFNGERIVVVARMVRDGEDPSVDAVHALANSDVLMPDIWYSIWGTEKPVFPEESSTPASSSSSTSSKDTSSSSSTPSTSSKNDSSSSSSPESLPEPKPIPSQPETPQEPTPPPIQPPEINVEPEGE